MFFIEPENSTYFKRILTITFLKIIQLKMKESKSSGITIYESNNQSYEKDDTKSKIVFFNKEMYHMN